MLGRLPLDILSLVGLHAHEAALQIEALSLRPDVARCTALSQFRQIALVHISEVVEIAIFLGHCRELTWLDRRFYGRLREELWVNIGHI